MTTSSITLASMSIKRLINNRCQRKKMLFVEALRLEHHLSKLSGTYCEGFRSGDIERTAYYYVELKYHPIEFYKTCPGTCAYR